MNNRIYKFRAWDKDKKVIIGWDYICNIGIDHFFDNRGIELMQYTGLKDKKNVEIYEGDIVSSDKMFGEVVWGYQASWGIHGKVIEKDWDKCEVIGNVFENPELLKETK